jgi:hypothetical protein
VILIIIGIAVPNIISSPDMFFTDNRNLETKFNLENFNLILNEKENVPESFLNIKNENKVICFVSSECNYCKLAIKKVSIISRKHSDRDDFLLVFLQGKNINSFLEETDTQGINYIIFNVLEFFDQQQSGHRIQFFGRPAHSRVKVSAYDINGHEIQNYMAENTVPTIE